MSMMKLGGKLSLQMIKLEKMCKYGYGSNNGLVLILTSVSEIWIGEIQYIPFYHFQREINIHILQFWLDWDSTPAELILFFRLANNPTVILHKSLIYQGGNGSMLKFNNNVEVNLKLLKLNSQHLLFKFSNPYTGLLV